MGATSAVSPARPQINIGFVVLISVAAALGGFLFGFDSAVVNGAVPGIQASFNSTSAQIGFSSCLPPARRGAGWTDRRTAERSALDGSARCSWPAFCSWSRRS